MFIMSSHSLCINDIHLVHMHAIGVPKGVTLVEFKGMCQNKGELAPAQEAQPPEPEGGEEVMLECPSHEMSSFVKGKPQSIISLLLYKSN
jgi:hypothetical protein